MAAIDVADDVSIGLEYDVFVNETRSWDRGSAGMNRAMNSVFPSPGDHLACGFSVLDATQPYLAENIHACCCERFEVVFDHSVLDYRSACMSFDPPRPERLK